MVERESIEAAHPLVATRALLEGRARPLPSPVGERRPNGALGSGALETLMAVGEALFSKGGAPPPEERMDFLRREVTDSMARGGPMLRLQITLAALVVSVIAPLCVGRIGRARGLPLALRVEALSKMERARAAPMLIAIRALLCLLYYEHPDAAAEAGLPVRGPKEGGGA